MKKTVALTLLAICATPAQSENGVLLMSVNNIGAEQENALLVQEMTKSFSEQLEKSSGSKIRVVISTDATTELQRTRTGYYDILLAPAHIIGSAAKNEYIPLASANVSNSAKLIVRKDSGIKTIAQIKGKRLCLPHADSLATYLVKGMLNENNLAIKSMFPEIKYARYSQSCLYSLENKLTDIVAVTDDIFKSWPARDIASVVIESRPVPGVSFAVNKRVPDVTREKLLQSVMAMKGQSKTSLLGILQAEKFEASSKDNFDYVAKLGYHTPAQLSGATVVTATKVQEFISKGGKLFDTRSESEFKVSHISGATSLSYQEKSDKSPDFDPALDKFDLAQLPKDKNTPILFACNGAECWKSYKASVLAVRNGYTKVYWFRGGFPEWKKEGLPIAEG
ncbi:MAG: PhnD/SsuA/transferrin family substrate-binding protein [Sulfuricellaceae bacterium]|nr:PhnD/SsuA/transferrin family substrate-binding protein [Sulfuricellaceae bacterium]